MPRKQLKMSARDVQQSRSEWWQFHYEKRAMFKALNPNEQHTYQNASMLISPPTMTIYGGLPEAWPTRDDFRALSRVQAMEDIDLCCPWYVSEAGWQMFNELWNQLPEPVDLYTSGCVQVGDVVHTVHNRADVIPSERA